MGIKAGFAMRSATVGTRNITIDGTNHIGFDIQIEVKFPLEYLDKVGMNWPKVQVGDILIDQGSHVWKVDQILNENNFHYDLAVYLLNDYEVKPEFTNSTQRGLICTPVNGALVAPSQSTITELNVFRQAMSYTFESGGGGGGGSGTGGSVDGIGSTSSSSPGSDAVGVKTYGSGTVISSGTLTQALQNIYEILSGATSGRQDDVGANKIVKRDISGSFYANEVKAIATKAKWADYAEKYTYLNEIKETGTVVCVSTDPEFESERCKDDCSLKVIGIISENPGFLINSESEGVIVALKGMVPAMVKGPVKKGDILVSTSDGFLRVAGTKSEELYRVALSLETHNKENSVIKVIL